MLSASRCFRAVPLLTDSNNCSPLFQSNGSHPIRKLHKYQCYLAAKRRREGL